MSCPARHVAQAPVGLACRLRPLTACEADRQPRGGVSYGLDNDRVARPQVDFRLVVGGPLSPLTPLPDLARLNPLASSFKSWFVAGPGSDAAHHELWSLGTPSRTATGRIPRPLAILSASAWPSTWSSSRRRSNKKSGTSACERRHFKQRIRRIQSRSVTRATHPAPITAPRAKPPPTPWASLLAHLYLLPQRYIGGHVQLAAPNTMDKGGNCTPELSWPSLGWEGSLFG